jgi:hypothetical protein
MARATQGNLLPEKSPGCIIKPYLPDFGVLPWGRPARLTIPESEEPLSEEVGGRLLIEVSKDHHVTSKGRSRDRRVRWVEEFVTVTPEHIRQALPANTRCAIVKCGPVTCNEPDQMPVKVQVNGNHLASACAYVFVIAWHDRNLARKAHCWLIKHRNMEPIIVGAYGRKSDLIAGRKPRCQIPRCLAGNFANRQEVRVAGFE